MAFRKISSSVSRRCVSFLTSRFCRAASSQTASTSTPAGSTIRQRPPPSDTPSAPISGSAVRRCRSSPVTSSSTKCRFERRSSSRLQWCTIAPSFRITASSHTCSMSRSRWEQTSTFIPCSSFMSTMSLSIRRRAAGSSPLVGSSSTTSSGPWTIACASLAICFMPYRVGPQLPVARLPEPDVEQHLVRLLERRLRREARQLGHLAHEGHRRHLPDERVVLGHVADSRPGLAHVAPAVQAQDAGAAGAGPEKPEQRQDQRGLARPVGPEQPHRLSCARNAETAGDPVEDLPPSQLDLQVLEFDDRCRSQAPPTRRVTAGGRRRIAAQRRAGPGSRSASRP